MDAVLPRKRRVFKTPAEREEANKERRKKKDSRRILVGSAWPEWERQRAICGGIGHIHFIHHLLAVHQAKCNTLVVSSLENISANR